MNVLGINQVPNMIAWMHDSAAALVADGEIIATAEEERFNRQRHARGYPKLAVDYCLKEGGIELNEVDIIAVAHDPWAFIRRLRINLWPSNLVKEIANLIVFELYTRNLARRAGAKRVFISHHLAHAASTYRCSGFKEANILTVDGSGETESFVFFKGSNEKIERVWDIPLGGFLDKKKSASIGMVYTKVTNMLSMGVMGEGKTMGLASYGEPKYDFSSILNIKNHKEHTIDRRNLGTLYKDLGRAHKDDPLTQEHKDLAASLQHALEESVINLAREAHEHTGYKNFALAGGVTLNCNTNSRILAEDFCDAIFIQPAAHDGGIALGAALEASAQVGDDPDTRIINAYYGPGFTDDEIEKLLKNAKVEYSKYENIEGETAKLVTKGNIVGWFQGRMEMGPRALGNRTILADPTIEGMDDEVNIYVKHREVWRPFAPSVTEEAATEYFEGVDKATESPFMLHTFYVKKKYKDAFPSITHIDGSSRIQTVRKEQNPRYHRLLREIGKINGHPMTMNTSFNDAGEPIVCTPKDALRCYSATGMDALAIGSFLLKKKTVRE